MAKNRLVSKAFANNEVADLLVQRGEYVNVTNDEVIVVPSNLPELTKEIETVVVGDAEKQRMLFAAIEKTFHYEYGGVREFYIAFNIMQNLIYDNYENNLSIEVPKELINKFKESGSYYMRHFRESKLYGGKELKYGLWEEMMETNRRLFETTGISLLWRNSSYFVLQDHLENWDIDAETLSKEYGFKISKNSNTTRVTTLPKTIIFWYGHPEEPGTDENPKYGVPFEFAATFKYVNGKISKIILDPIFKGLERPLKPSKKNQKLKTSLCRTFLLSTYGRDNCNMTGEDFEWETEKYFVGCYLIMKGPLKYTDGNITFKFKKEPK